MLDTKKGIGLRNADVIDGYLLCDARAQGYPIVDVSRGFCRLTGYCEADVMGRSCDFLQGSETDQAVVRKIGQALQNGHAFQGELLNYRKDGTPFWNKLTITPMPDVNGEIEYFMGIQTGSVSFESEHSCVAKDKLAYHQAEIDVLKHHLSYNQRLGLWQADAQGKGVSFDGEHLLKMFNCSAEELMGDRWVEKIHPDDQKRLMNQWMQYVTSGATTFYERNLRIVLPSGMVLWATFTALPHIVDGKITGYSGVVIDASQSVKDSLYRYSMNTWKRVVKDALLCVNDKGCVIQVNTPACTLFSKSEFELIGVPFESLLSADDVIIYELEFKLFQTTGRHDIFNVGREVKIKCGQDLVYAYLNISIDDSQDSPMFIAILRELTMEKASQKLLIDERNTLQLILDTMQDALICMNDRGEVVRVNTSMLSMLGYQERHLIGQHVSFLIDGSDNDNVGQWLAGKSVSGFVSGQFLSAKHADGHAVPVSITIGKMKLGNQQVLVAVMRDMRAHVAQVSHLDSRKEQVERILRLSMVSETAASIVHQIKQPVAALDMLLQTINQSVNGEQLQQVRALSQKIVRVTDGIMGALHQKKTQKINFSIVSLKETIRTRFNHSGVMLDWRISKMLGENNIQVDQFLLEQVLILLIQNACDSFLNLAIPQEKIQLVFSLIDNKLIVDCIDNGPGVPDEIRKSIFEPFFSTKQESSGVGLALAKSLLIVVGGDVVLLESEYGAHFRFYFPVNDEY